MLNIKNELKVQDAVCHRFYCIGIVASDISEEFRSKYKDFPWYSYTYWIIGSDPDIIWDLNKGNHHGSHDFESIESLFFELEKIYLKEFFPDKAISSNKFDKMKSWPKEHKYPIKSNKSIWTVKKR